MMHVILATMSMEGHGGVADQMTNLAMTLPEHGVSPIVLVRNPLCENHNYVRLLRQEGVPVWAVSARLFQLVRTWCVITLFILSPVIFLEALFRQKTWRASQQTAWAVLRRIGYWGLDGLFLLRLFRARLWLRARIAHFRKPDSWPKIRWAKRLRFFTIYTEDTVPVASTRHYYEGIAQVRVLVDAFTAVSQASADALSAFLEPGTSIKVIPNMVESPHKDVARESDSFFHIASIARLAAQKDVATVITAVALLIPYNSNLRLHIYGDGPLRAQLEEQVKALGIQDYVHFAGVFSKKDLPQVMSQIDVVVLSTHYEGFGVALVEGMAYGKPVIGTAVSGVTEVIDDSATGFLVPPKSPEILARKIEELAKNTALYQRMSEAGREKYLNNFTPEIVAQQYINVYQSTYDTANNS